MAKYLVTGGAGFIGSNLVDKLIEKGHEVVVIDNLSTGKKENINPSAKFYQFDICDIDKIYGAFDGVKFVFHLAAIPSVPMSIQDPVGTSEINILGTINVLRAAQVAGCKRVIFASSSAVYGDQKEFPIKESAVLNFKSPYALHKLVGEQYARLFTDIYKLPVICLRYFNVYGPRIDINSDYSLVIGKFLKLHAQNMPLTIFGDGNQTRSFCYVDDVIEANIKASENDKLVGGEVINIGHEKSFSINSLAELIGGKIQYLPERLGDILHTQADISLAKELLNWEPKICLRDGVEKTKQWFLKNEE